MLSFKNYLTEQIEHIPDLEAEINGYLAAKEILKPKYEELKRKVDKVFKHIFEVEIAKPFFYGKGAELDKLHDEKLRDLTWSHVESARDLLALKNKMNKVKMKDHLIYQAYDSFYHDFSPLAQKIIDLKQYVVTTAKKREEAKQVQAAEKNKRIVSASSLIKVLTSFINQYVLEAENRARTFYDKTMKEVIDAGGLDMIAPQVDFHKVGHEAYKRAEAKRAFYRMMMHKSKDQYITEAGQAAHSDYMEWVHKMIEKIGKPVVDAEMTGNPWKGSTIHVTTEDGEKQTWTTTMIINQSKYGKLFNQFPSRKK